MTWLQQDTTDKTGYRIDQAQCKMKSQGPLFKEQGTAVSLILDYSLNLMIYDDLFTYLFRGGVMKKETLSAKQLTGDTAWLWNSSIRYNTVRKTALSEVALG